MAQKKLGMFESLVTHSKPEPKKKQKSPIRPIKELDSKPLITSPEQNITTKEEIVVPKRGRGKSADPSKIFSVSATVALYEELRETATAHGIPANALHRFLLIEGLRQIKSGKLKIPMKQTIDLG